MINFRKKSLGSWLITISMYALALTWLYPYVWMVMASLKPTPEIFNTSLFSGTLTLENYQFLFGSAEKLNRPFLRSLFNSFFVTLSVTLSVLVTSAYIAYAMAKIDFWGREKLNNFLLFQMVLPGLIWYLPTCALLKMAATRLTVSVCGLLSDH